MVAFVSVALTAGAWSAERAGAQSPPEQRKCVSIHEVHPTLTAHDAQSTAAPVGYRVYSLADVPGEQMFVREEPLIHSREVAEARPDLDKQTKQPIVTLRLDDAGKRKFGQFTSANVKRPLAVVIGGQVITAPMIQTPILGGSFQISGSFTVDDARKLAETISSGKCR